MLAALDDIVDPCSQAAGVPVGIVEMGLVTRVEVRPVDDGGVDVAVAIGVTDPTCWMGAVFVAEALRRLHDLGGVRQVDVGVDAELDWTESHMDATARDRLARARVGRRTDLPLVDLDRVRAATARAQQG